MTYKKNPTEKRGRKALDESLRKIAIQIYLERYKIDKIGGIEKAQEILIKHLQTKLNEHDKETN